MTAHVTETVTATLAIAAAAMTAVVVVVMIVVGVTIAVAEMIAVAGMIVAEGAAEIGGSRAGEERRGTGIGVSTIWLKYQYGQFFNESFYLG